MYSTGEDLLVLDFPHPSFRVENSASSIFPTLGRMSTATENEFLGGIHPKITTTALKRDTPELVQNQQRNRKAGYRVKFFMHSHCLKSKPVPTKGC